MYHIIIALSTSVYQRIISVNFSVLTKYNYKHSCNILSYNHNSIPLTLSPSLSLSPVSNWYTDDRWKKISLIQRLTPHIDHDLFKVHAELSTADCSYNVFPFAISSSRLIVSSHIRHDTVYLAVIDESSGQVTKAKALHWRRMGDRPPPVGRMQRALCVYV